MARGYYVWVEYGFTPSIDIEISGTASAICAEKILGIFVPVTMYTNTAHRLNRIS